jgi:hypothetical protein
VGSRELAQRGGQAVDVGLVVGEAHERHQPPVVGELDVDVVAAS